MPAIRTSERKGMTLIELLIVIAIVAILIQMVLPAIQASRETARKLQCSNNLRQVALGFQLHHDQLSFLPSSGWGYFWTGHPDRGYGQDQPGGWAYNILAFIEEGRLRELGTGLPDGSVEKARAILQANATPLPLFNCPTRRPAMIYPVIHKGFSPILPGECMQGDGASCQVARGDYAANSGSINELPGADSGPPSLAEAATWKWVFSGKDAVHQNGISYQRSHVRYAMITDGLSHTYCVGERFIELGQYETGDWPNDDQGLFVGHDGDANRYTGSVDGKPISPIQDTKYYKYLQFGSAHPTSCNMAFCDGSVQAVSYDVDPEIHRLRGGRDDGSADSSE